MLYVHGVKGIFTAHGESIEDIISNPILNTLYKTNIFERIIFLDKDRQAYIGYEKQNKIIV